MSPRGTDSGRDWEEDIFAPATLMRLAAGAGREAQERTFIIRDAEPLTAGDVAPSPSDRPPSRRSGARSHSV